MLFKVTFSFSLSSPWRAASAILIFAMVEESSTGRMAKFCKYFCRCSSDILLKCASLFDNCSFSWTLKIYSECVFVLWQINLPNIDDHVAMLSAHCEHVRKLERDPSCAGSAMSPECPRKDWRGKSCWPHPRESGPEVVQGPGGVTASPTLLGPVLVQSQQNYLKLLTVRYFGSSQGFCPKTLPRGKASMKMNVWPQCVPKRSSETMLN